MLSVLEQNKIKDEILQDRLVLANKVMKECDVEAWLIASREYNEDPLFHALTPANYLTARRITILLLTQKDGTSKNYSISLPDEDLETYYTRSYNPKEESQMEALTNLLQNIKPKNIAINTSDHFAYTDGLTVGLYRLFMKELPREITNVFISSDEVGIRFLETRTPKEIEIYPMVMKEAIDIIESAYSNTTIIPNVTTCNDVVNHLKQEVNNRGITYWFEPTIDVQREDGMHSGDTIIQRGDLIHCDFGITYLNLCTDTQRLCYVLKEHETEVPKDIYASLKKNNRFQDIVIEQMKQGISGNEVFEKSMKKAQEEHIRAMLYTHPLGFHGHAAGPIFGLYTNQNRIPVRGDLKIHNDTGYALELNIVDYVETYKRDIYFYTEESILFIDDKVQFLASGRDHIYQVGEKQL